MAIPRIQKRRDFLRAARTGKRAGRPGVVLQAQAVPDAPLRLGFTVTKKVGNAVIRNRTKRRLRAAARLVLGEAPPQVLEGGGWDLVLIGRDDTRTRDFRDLMGDVRGALKQTGVLR